jgi:hypothetical protein
LPKHKICQLIFRELLEMLLPVDEGTDQPIVFRFPC